MPAAVQAQPARIAVTVLDPEGKPLPDVDILVTTPDRGDVKVKATTNPKGKATVMVPNVTLTYDMALEREGYESLTVDVKPQFGETTFREFTLAPVGAAAAAPAPAAADSAPSFTPAQLAFNAGVEALGKQDADTALAKFLEAREQGSEPVAGVLRARRRLPREEAAAGGARRGSSASSRASPATRAACGWSTRRSASSATRPKPTRRSRS